MADERQKLLHELEALNAQYIRMDHSIGEKAVSLKVPYIKPALVEINQDLREEITIEQYSRTSSCWWQAGQRLNLRRRPLRILPGQHARLLALLRIQTLRALA